MVTISLQSIFFFANVYQYLKWYYSKYNFQIEFNGWEMPFKTQFFATNYNIPLLNSFFFHAPKMYLFIRQFFAIIFFCVWNLVFHLVFTLQVCVMYAQYYSIRLNWVCKVSVCELCVYVVCWKNWRMKNEKNEYECSDARFLAFATLNTYISQIL